MMYRVLHFKVLWSVFRAAEVLLHMDNESAQEIAVAVWYSLDSAGGGAGPAVHYIRTGGATVYCQSW